MATPARTAIYTHLQRAVARWPKDRLRPETQLQDVLAKRLESKQPIGPGSGAEAEQLKQVNAIYSLLEDRYKTRYRIQGQLMQPKSNPTYYDNLITELEEAPTRTWYQRIAKRLGGMVRLQ